MEFQQYKTLQQQHLADLFAKVDRLYVTHVNKDTLWNLYLDSFPVEHNRVYRQHRKYDCNCCKQFIRAFGNVVAIVDNQLVSIWDFVADDIIFNPVNQALSAYVKSQPILYPLVTDVRKFGTDKNYDQSDSDVMAWHHFYIELPKKFVTTSKDSIGRIQGSFRELKQVFQRSLEELTPDSIATVLELIATNSLYKGEEWQQLLRSFQQLQIEYSAHTNKELYCWETSLKVGPALAKIRNHSIGTLLIDLSKGLELNEAIRKYESIVAPTNYKRPQAIFTARQVAEAETTIAELGLSDSLGRRFARLDDITVNDILFADRDTAKQLTSVFDELKASVPTNVKKFDRVDEIPVETFISNVLPTISGLEVLFEPTHASNLVSLIAPAIKDSASLFKWNNGFSWAYNGNITDSMKQRVKAAGGNVDGVLRFSLQWNDNGDNQNDFDAHCVEPNGNEIYFSKKRNPYTTGVLDVDIVSPRGKVAVENITWSDIDRMLSGEYHFFVHNFSHWGGRSGFTAEIEYAGQIYSYSYDKELKLNERVTVARLNFSKAKGIEIIESLAGTQSSPTFWNLQTNRFHPVSALMLSPNYWESEAGVGVGVGVGNRHYLFLLKGCINDTQPNGFFNEFLKQDLLTHKRVFEALGARLKVPHSQDQLSGLGFSTTQRNQLVCKLIGNTERIVKVTF